MKDSILVTGGAGYIGSHISKRLLELGKNVIILDNLSTGHIEVCDLFKNKFPDSFKFENVNLMNVDEIKRVFSENNIVGVIDFAAFSLVGESQEKARTYFENNVLAFHNLLSVLDVPIVKSSTAATYGNPSENFIPLKEDYQSTVKFDESQLSDSTTDFDTIISWWNSEIKLSLSDQDINFLRVASNVYGLTKIMDELLLKKLDKRYVALRYFNVMGADPSGLIGESHNPETHLVPIVYQVLLGEREKLMIFGDDYPTRDGTCVRDYISVNDLTTAHIMALDHLLSGGNNKTYNLGTSEGFTVKEIISSVETATKLSVNTELGSRRAGDPDVLIADPTLVNKELGWVAKEPINASMGFAWQWHKNKKY